MRELHRGTRLGEAMVQSCSNSLPTDGKNPNPLVTACIGLQDCGRLVQGTIVDNGAVQFDQLNKVTKPFQILSGGYQIIFKNGKWSQVFGSVSKKKRFGREDRRGHRSEQRVRATKNKLRRADKKRITRLERRI